MLLRTSCSQILYHCLEINKNIINILPQLSALQFVHSQCKVNNQHNLDVYGRVSVYLFYVYAFVLLLVDGIVVHKTRRNIVNANLIFIMDEQKAEENNNKNSKTLCSNISYKAFSTAISLSQY